MKNDGKLVPLWWYEHRYLSVPTITARQREKAAQLGISLAEYFRRVIGRDLQEQWQAPDIAIIFDLGASGQSDVSSNIDRYVGESVEAEYEQETRP